MSQLTLLDCVTRNKQPRTQPTDDATHEQSATSCNTTPANFEVCSPINSSDSSILEVSDIIKAVATEPVPVLYFCA